jgi:cell division protein FtsZ
MLRKRTVQHFARIRVVDIQEPGGSPPSLFEEGINGVGFVSVSLDPVPQTAGQSDPASTRRAGRKDTPTTENGPALGSSYHLELGHLEELSWALSGAEIVLFLVDQPGSPAAAALLDAIAIAKRADALTIGVMPYIPMHRGPNSEAALHRRLCQRLDTMLVVPDLAAGMSQFGSTLTVTNHILYQGIQSLSDLLNMPGLINVDFADLSTVFKGGKIGILSVGQAYDLHQAPGAIWAALRRIPPGVRLDESENILLNVTGGRDMSIQDVHDIAQIVSAHSGNQANFIMGAVVDEGLEDEVRVTLIATGMGGSSGIQA